MMQGVISDKLASPQPACILPASTKDMTRRSSVDFCPFKNNLMIQGEDQQSAHQLE